MHTYINVYLYIHIYIHTHLAYLTHLNLKWERLGINLHFRTVNTVGPFHTPLREQMPQSEWTKGLSEPREWAEGNTYCLVSCPGSLSYGEQLPGLRVLLVCKGTNFCPTPYGPQLEDNHFTQCPTKEILLALRGKKNPTCVALSGK